LFAVQADPLGVELLDGRTRVGPCLDGRVGGPGGLLPLLVEGEAVQGRREVLGGLVARPVALRRHVHGHAGIVLAEPERVGALVVGDGALAVVIGLLARKVGRGLVVGGLLGAVLLGIHPGLLLCERVAGVLLARRLGLRRVLAEEARRRGFA